MHSGEISSKSPESDAIEREILEEIARIERDVVRWSPRGEKADAWSLEWLPRSQGRAFRQVDGQNIVPLDVQAYYDLQLSRGAMRPTSPGGQWQFDSPHDGIGVLLRRNEERLEHFLSYVPLKKSSPILELGARSGQLLYFLRHRGFERAAGIDVVRLNVLWCKKNGLHVELLDAHELSSQLDPDTQEAVFAYHVLEHCHDPRLVLEEIHKVLSVSGGVHVEVPLGPANMRYAHLHGFRRGQLGAMLGDAGYFVVDTHCPRRGGYERIVATKRPIRGMRRRIGMIHSRIRMVRSRWKGSSAVVPA